MMEVQIRYVPTMKMRDLVKDNHSLIMVMSRFGIPLGFGDRSVRDVCLKNGVDESTFLTVANFCSGHPFNASEISLQSLSGYLKRSHEYYRSPMWTACSMGRSAGLSALTTSAESTRPSMPK